MPNVKLTTEELWEVIDAGCIVLGYIQDGSHDMTVHHKPLALSIKEPGSRKGWSKERQKTIQTFPTRDSAFKDYQIAPYTKEEEPARLEISYHASAHVADSDDIPGTMKLAIMLTMCNIGIIAVQIAAYFW